jgi:hypothetical protein
LIASALITVGLVANLFAACFDGLHFSNLIDPLNAQSAFPSRKHSGRQVLGCSGKGASRDTKSISQVHVNPWILVKDSFVFYLWNWSGPAAPATGIPVSECLLRLDSNLLVSRSSDWDSSQRVLAAIGFRSARDLL